MGRLSSGALAAACLAAVGVPAGVWLVTGWHAVEREEQALREAPGVQARQAASELAATLAERLEVLRDAESLRPYYHYQNLYHDPRGASGGASVLPSPLAAGPADPLIDAYFQIDPSGRLTMPTVNDELPELSQQPSLAHNLQLLAELRQVAALRAHVRAPQIMVAAAEPPRPRSRPRRPATPTVAISAQSKSAVAISAQSKSAVAISAQSKPAVAISAQSKPGGPELARSGGSNVEVLDPSSYQQNNSSNAVYRLLRGTPSSLAGGPAPEAAPAAPPRPIVHHRRPSPAPSPPPAPPPIVITTAALQWQVIELAGEPRLAALRDVTTPDGTMTQGWILSTAAASTWLAALRAATFPAHLEPGVPHRPEDALLALGGGAFHVAVDPGAAEAQAAASARGVRRAFLWRFLPTSGFALLAGLCLVLLFRRSERLALERSRFAASAAHELRTPLAGLAMYGEMLAEGLGDPARSRHYSQRIADEAVRLGRVVDNVLGFTQLERRSLVVRPRPEALAEVVGRAVERLRPAIEAQGARLHLEVAPALPDLPVDRDAVGQIVQNLVDNAEKYTRGDAVRDIRVAVRGNADGATIEVLDQGRGIPERKRRALFRPFVRGGDESAAGLGLGLALCQALARAHGGEVSYRPAPGGGACFVVRLPSAQPKLA